MRLIFLTLLIFGTLVNSEVNEEAVLKALRCDDGASIEYINSRPFLWQDEISDQTHDCTMIIVKCSQGDRSSVHYKRLPYCVLQ